MILFRPLPVAEGLVQIAGHLWTRCKVKAIAGCVECGRTTPKGREHYRPLTEGDRGEGDVHRNDRACVRCAERGPWVNVL